MKNKIFLRVKCACIAVFMYVLSFSIPVSAKPFNEFAGNTFSLNYALSLDQSEAEIFDLVNEQRRRSRLNLLEWDGELAQVARDYSRKMARGNFFDHYDADGASVVERAKNARVKNWSKIGENLFYGENIDEFSRVAVKGWMKSPTHKQNILDRDWNRSGIGVYVGRGNQIYVTQVFIER
jgi:uncharacterized protein YkwD